MVKFRYSKENFYNCHFIGDLSLAERAARINELKRLTPDEVEMADKLSNIITLEHWPDWENAVYKTRYENGIPHFSLFFHAERRKAVGINDNLLSLGKEPLFPSNSDEEESEDEEEPVLAAVQSNTSRKRKRQDQDDPAEKKARLYRKMGEFKFKKDELDCRFEFEHPKGKQLWDSMKAFPRFLGKSRWSFFPLYRSY